MKLTLPTVTSMNIPTQQSDLSWPLKNFNHPEMAGKFFNQFNGAFAVYSSSVGKIYTDYTAEVVSANDALLVVQPNMYEFSSIFHNINEHAVKRTSILLFEDNGVQKLSGVIASNNTRKSFDLKEGLFRLFSGDFIDGAFLPLITYGDLRSLPDLSQPIMQLHGLVATNLSNLSQFQIQDVIATVRENLIGKLEHL